jgi:hypothetical protein
LDSLEQRKRLERIEISNSICRLQHVFNVSNRLTRIGSV